MKLKLLSELPCGKPRGSSLRDARQMRKIAPEEIRRPQISSGRAGTTDTFSRLTRCFAQIIKKPLTAKGKAPCGQKKAERVGNPALLFCIVI
jgi:hypothetical protein